MPGMCELKLDPQGRLVDFSAVQSIATSHGRDDAGLFELSFRDDRYAPFEGAGAISDWRLDLPKTSNAFNFATITDVVLRINYTAREGGDLLRNAARQAAILPALTEISATNGTASTPPAQPNLCRLFSARHEFPDAWHAFLYPTPTVAGQTLIIDLSPERFPYAVHAEWRPDGGRAAAELRYADAVRGRSDHQIAEGFVHDVRGSVPTVSESSLLEQAFREVETE